MRVTINFGMHKIDMINVFLKYRYYYILIQAVVLGFLTLIVYLWNLKNSIEIFNFLILWNIITYSFVLYNELVKSPGFHPFIIFALITLQYCGFSPIQTVNLMNSGEVIYLGGTAINQVLTLGYLFLSIEHYLIYCGYFLYDSYRLKREAVHISMIDSFSQSNINPLRIGFYNYIFVLFLRVIGHFIPLASFSSLLVTYAERGFLVSLAIFSYALILDYNNRIKKMYWGITIIEILYVLNTGMKQTIITPLLPYMIYLIIAYKQGLIRICSFKYIVKFSLILIFVIGFVFPYISSFRSLANEKHKEWHEIRIYDAFNAYINDMFSVSNNDEKQNGLEYFMSRAGSIGSNSFSIDYADKRGISPEYFLYSTSAVIPRVLWPDKPKILVGSTAYYMSLGYAYEEALAKAQKANKTASITLGFIGSSYLAFGFIGAIVVCLLAGYLTARIWHFVKYRQYNVLAVWLFYTLMTAVFIDYENFIDCGLMFYMWSVVYIIMVKIIDYYFFKWNENVYSS